MSRIKSDLGLLMILIQNFKSKGINNYRNYFPSQYGVAVVAVVINVEAFMQCSAVFSVFAVWLVTALILKLLILLQCQLLNCIASFFVGQPEYAA